MKSSEKLIPRLVREASIVFVKEISKDIAQIFSGFVKHKMKKNKDKQEKEEQE